MRAPTYKVVILGPENAGKSSLLRATVPQTTDAKQELRPTVGVDVRTHVAENARIHIWDTSGNERFKSIRQAFYKSTRLFIIVVNNTNFDALQSDINEFLEEIKTSSASFKVGLVINFRDRLLPKPEDVNLADDMRHRFEFVEIISVCKMEETGRLIQQKLIEYAQALTATKQSRTSSVSSMDSEATTPHVVRQSENTSFSEKMEHLSACLPSIPSARDIRHGFGRLFSCCDRRSTSENLEEVFIPRNSGSGS